MSAVANSRVQRGKSNSINDGEASKAPATDSPDKANSATVNSRKCTPSYGSPQAIQPSTADDALSTPGPTGMCQKTAGNGKSDIRNTTKQSIDVLISKFDSFLQLREQDPSLRGKLPLGSSTATSRPGAKGELKYVTHPLVLNARAALMSPEGRQKKPDVANEDEKRGTKLEEILFRRRPSLRTPADSPAGGTIGNEKQGNATARKDTRPVTTANANSSPFDRTRAAGALGSKNISESSDSPMVSFAIVVLPSENGRARRVVTPSSPASGAALAQIPPFNPNKWNSGNSPNSPNSPSGRNGRIENPRPTYPQSSPVASHRLEIPPYKPKSESPSRDRGHVDTSTDQSILTKVNSPRFKNETTAQIPPYQSKRAVVDDLPNGFPIAKSIVKTKNGSPTGSQITVPDIPPFKPKTQGAQQPVVNAKSETSSPTPGPSQSKHTTAKNSVEKSLTNGANQTPTIVPSKSVPQSSVLEDSTASNAHSPSGSSHKKKSEGKSDGHTTSPRVGNVSNAKHTGNSSPLSTDGVSNKTRSSTSSKPPLLPTSSHSLSKSKPESEPTSSPRINKSPLDVFNSSTNTESSSPSMVTSCKGGSKPIDPKRLRLQNTWTLSYDSRTGSKAIYGNKEKYESNLQSICSFDNVADFFGVCNNVPKPSQLENNSNYQVSSTPTFYSVSCVQLFSFNSTLSTKFRPSKDPILQLFKNGIKPMWEDAANANGGSWTISFGRQTNSEVLNKVWLSLQCAAIGETLDPGDDICGVVLNRRGRGDRLAVWVRDGSNKRSNAEIRKRLDELLDLTSEQVTVAFSLHEDYVGSGILYGK